MDTGDRARTVCLALGRAPSRCVQTGVEARRRPAVLVETLDPALSWELLVPGSVGLLRHRQGRPGRCQSVDRAVGREAWAALDHRMAKKRAAPRTSEPGETSPRHGLHLLESFGERGREWGRPPTVVPDQGATASAMPAPRDRAFSFGTAIVVRGARGELISNHQTRHPFGFLDPPSSLSALTPTSRSPGVRIRPPC